MPISIASYKASSTRSPTTRPQATSLAKRLLFPALPTDDLPPLLTSAVPPELNAELYEFIALALRAFVNPWWTKITRYDKEFLPEVTRIVTHVVRDVETRVIAVDFTSLLCRDIPLIIIQHYRDYRNAESKLSTSYATGGALSLQQLFHQLQPHIAVSPDGQLNEVYFRQVVDHILLTSLPPEDSAAEVERHIIREVVVKIVLKDIIPTITQPWFIEKVIVDQLGPQPLPVLTTEPSLHPVSNFSFHSLLILFLSAIQSISGACLALIQTYKQAVNTIKLVNQSSTPSTPGTPPNLSATTPGGLEQTASSGSISPLSPSSLSRTHSVSSTASSVLNPVSSACSGSETEAAVDMGFYAQAPLLMASEIFTSNDRYAASVIQNTARMVASLLGPFLDKLLPFILQRVMSSILLLNIIRIGKRSLFPTGYPAPAHPDPTPQEQAATHAKLLAWRGKGAAAHIVPIMLGNDAKSTLQAAIDPLSNQACNAHLITILLDRIIAALYPDLIGTSPS